MSSLAGGHKTLVPNLIEELKKYDSDDKMIVVGGVIPKKDYDFLFAQGVKCIFGPGSNIGKSACTILESLIKSIG